MACCGPRLNPSTVQNKTKNHMEVIMSFTVPSETPLQVKEHAGDDITGNQAKSKARTVSVNPGLCLCKLGM